MRGHAFHFTHSWSKPPQQGSEVAVLLSLQRVQLLLKNRDSSNSSVRLFSHVTGSRAASRTLFCLLLWCLNHHHLLSKGAWKETLLVSNSIFSTVYLKSWTVVPRFRDSNGLRLLAVFLCVLGDLCWGNFSSLNYKCGILSFLSFIIQHL